MAVASFETQGEWFDVSPHTFFIMTIKEEIFDQVEELNCSLRELTNQDLIDCRSALIDRTKTLFSLIDEL